MNEIPQLLVDVANRTVDASLDLLVRKPFRCVMDTVLKGVKQVLTLPFYLPLFPIATRVKKTRVALSNMLHLE